MKITTILGLVILSCFLTTDNKYLVKKTSIASDSRSDWFPIKYKDGILFSSREKKEPYFKLYYSEIIGSEHLDEPIEISVSSRDENLFSSDYIEESGELYLTASRRNIDTRSTTSYLLKAEIENLGLKNIEELHLGGSNIVFSNPTFSNDGLKMIINSNSFGSIDLLEYGRDDFQDSWRFVRRIEELYLENMTNGYPRLYNDSLLVFSRRSNDIDLLGSSHLDLYSAKLQENGLWGEAKFMEGLNSKYDEVGLIFLDDKSGYFTSKVDQDIDIYYFEKE